MDRGTSGGGVATIDTLMSGYAGITASFFIPAERPCLIEAGTATSAATVRDELAAMGVGPQDLATIVVTHVHLDHAGGVGDLAEMFPRAQVVVHEAGARHLVDPERLVSSARRVFGRVLDEVMGLLRPTASERVTAVSDGAVIELGGGRKLECHAAPGHAKHHIALLDSDRGDLFVGDAAGVYVPETGDLRPATPPPDFDLELASGTLQRFRALQARRLVFTHYGPVTPVEETLDRAEEEIGRWVELVRESRQAGLDLEHSVALLIERTKDRYAGFYADERVREKFEELNATAANIAGINRWLDRIEGTATTSADPASLR